MKLLTRSVIIAGVVSLAGCMPFIPRPKEPHVTSSLQAKERGGAVPSEADVAVPGPEQRLPEYERLTYEMRWVGISIGTVTTTIKGIEEINGSPAYVLEATAKTNSFCSAFYKIDDTFRSYMDIAELRTLRHEVHRREGKFRKDARTDFDQVNHKARYINIETNEKKEFDIPPRTQDTITASYYFMLLPMRLNDMVEYAVCNNERNYKLLALIGDRGTLRLPDPIGTRETFSVEPFAELQGERVDKGRVSAYYSWDKRRIPLYAIIKAPVFGSVTLSLIKIETERPVEKK